MGEIINERKRRAATYQLCDLWQIPVFSEPPCLLQNVGVITPTWPASQGRDDFQEIYRLTTPGWQKERPSVSGVMAHGAQ